MRGAVALRAGTGGVRPIVVAWFGVAAAVGAAGVWRILPFPLPLTALVLTAATLLLLAASPALRLEVRQLGVRRLIALHFVRLPVGLYFLALYRAGVLPGEFALAAGWGDVVVGVAAFPVLFWCTPVRTARQRMGLLLWNAVALVDILAVLGNGVRLFVRDSTLGEPFLTLPLVLLPTFLVPLIIVSHVLLFRGGAKTE